jgi:hypothetical protein
MPSSFQGFGSEFYGQRHFARDGSYITTEWAIFAGIPVIPIRSLRIIPKGSESIAFGFKDKYLVVSELPLDWPQVWCVWGFAFFLICWIIGEISLFIYLNLGRNWEGYLLLLCSLAPFALPVWLRRRAKKKIGIVRSTGVGDDSRYISVETLLREGTILDRFRVIGAIMAGLTIAALIILLLQYLR